MFSNKYHSISCGVCTVLFVIELVEGKGRSPQKEKEIFEERIKATSLLLRLYKSIFVMRRVVIIYSGFCVLQAIVELRKMSVVSAAVIKKDATG